MRTFGADELRRRVDEVLYYVWDPIGVSDEPFARAEYEDYVSSVLALVVDQEEAQPIVDHLAEIVKSMMELSPDKARCERTAKLLLLHKSAIQEGCA